MEKLGMAALVGAGTAAVLNVLLLILARGAGYEPMVKSGGMMIPEPIKELQVVISCIIPAIGASALLWALRRWSRKASYMFYKIAMIFLVLSMVGPAMVPVNRFATRIILGAMHLVAAGAIIGSLQRTGNLKK